MIVPTKVFCLIHNNHHYSWKQVLQYINMINTPLSRKLIKNFKNFQSYYVQCQQSILWILTFLLGLLNSWYFLIHKDTSHHFFFSRYTNYANYQWQVTPAHVVLFTDGASRKSFVSVVTQHGVRARLGFSVMVFFMDVYSIIKWISDEKDTNM